MFSNGNTDRDSLIDDLKKKIRDEKEMLKSRVASDSGEEPEDDPRQYRARKLSDVFKAMCFES